MDVLPHATKGRLMKFEAKCACGLSRLTEANTGYLQCLNCDMLTAGELQGLDREKTREDHNFQLAMTRKQESWYRNNG